jgi:hypothetical protein
MSDILTYGMADADDRAVMDTGCHYDYVAQAWRDGHDHAHFTSDDSPLVFCGADGATCRQGDPAPWGAGRESGRAGAILDVLPDSVWPFAAYWVVRGVVYDATDTESGDIARWFERAGVPVWVANGSGEVLGSVVSNPGSGGAWSWCPSWKAHDSMRHYVRSTVRDAVASSGVRSSFDPDAVPARE